MKDLQRKEFETFLNRLGSDPDEAASRYELLRRKLVKFFECRKCIAAEALADEAMDRTAKKLDTEHVQDINLFCFGVARRLLLETRRKTSRIISINQDPEGEISLAGEMDPEARIVEAFTQAKGIGCLKTCLAAMAAPNRQLIVEYYKGDKQLRIRQRQELAKQCGITIQALRNEANKVREKLKACVFRCLKQSAMQYEKLDHRFS